MGAMTARRTFVAVVIGGLVAWPLVARAQSPTLPTIGFLSSLSAGDRSRVVPSFLQGLRETGYVEGRNLAIEYRWAEGQYEQLPALADDLVRRHVMAIAALSGTPAGLAAKAATATIPIVFAIGGDPVGPATAHSSALRQRGSPFLQRAEQARDVSGTPWRAQLRRARDQRRIIE